MLCDEGVDGIPKQLIVLLRALLDDPAEVLHEQLSRVPRPRWFTQPGDQLSYDVVAPVNLANHLGPTGH